jgi:hypothetical protein
MMNWLLYLLPNLKLINQVVCLLKDECDQPCNKLHKVFACFQIQFRNIFLCFFSYGFSNKILSAFNSKNNLNKYLRIRIWHWN